MVDFTFLSLFRNVIPHLLEKIKRKINKNSCKQIDI